MTSTTAKTIQIYLPTGESVPRLIVILRQLGWRVFNIRRRLSRLKTRIQRAEKKNQPTTTLESQQEEELSVDLERYEDLLNDCAEAIHEATGIPTSKLVEVATSTTDGEDWDYIYAELKNLDDSRVNAELWKALLSRDQDALVSVGLLPSTESSPAAPETENQGSKADDDSGLTTMLSVGLLPSSESSPAVPETENQGSKADDESGLTTMLSVGLLPSSESSSPAPETPPGQRRRRTKPRMTVGKVQEHWRTVLASGNKDLIQDYLTLAETELAKRIGCSRGTLRRCEYFRNRRIALREFNRENG